MVGGSVVRACWARRRDRVVANDRGETRRGSSGHPRSLRAALAGLFAAALLLGWAPAASAQDARVLVYHPTPNATIDAGLDALEEAAADGDFEIQATTDPTAFTPANLADYKAVVFLNVTGDTLNSSQESALQAFIQAGNGFVGIGSSAEAETGVTFFNGLIGARPSTTVNGNYTVVAGDRVHPASRDLPLTAERNDAFYTWQSNPTGSVHTLIRVRSGEVAGDGTHPNIDRPLAWCRDFQGGRSVYTGLGRTVNSYDEAMEDHLRGAIQWAAGLVRGNCKATINSFYSATKLTQNNSPATALNQSGEPHGLSIAPNGWVIYIGRANCGDSNYIHDYSNPDVGKGCGTVHVWDPEQEENNGVTTAAIFEVYGNKGGGSETGSTHKIETGLLGVAVAPNFLETGHIYFYYYPSFNPNAEPQGLPDGAERRVTKMQRPRISRFTMDLETKKIDLDSEVIILDWESQIYSCCHRGGGMGFDSEGNLYVTTGDNNSSQGNYSGNWQSVRCPTGNPSQATASHCGDNNISYRDARRTAGNTNDLNGKMLRINPIDDIPDGTQPPIGPGSTYTIPGEDAPNGPNLFTGDEGNGNQARPEIYAMGLRNPSRLNIDPETDVPYTAWVGPDAGSPDPTQGPAKYEEFAAIPQAGNYGWPYCMGNKQAYRDRLPNDALRNDTPEGYVSGPNGTGGWYDCDNPRNDSTNNTGLTELPPVTPVNLWYGPGGGCPDFPRTASGVPTYDPGQVIQRCPYVTGGGGQAIMSGPIYGYDEDAPEGNGRWPEYWEHRPIVVDHYNGHIRHALLFDEDELGEGGLPVWADNMKSIIPAFGNYMDSKFGPDGALYVQSYGGGFFTIAGNYGLWRVTCDDCADTPGPDPQYEAVGAGEYQFSIGASGGVAYEWDFGDGSPTSAEPNPTHTYEEDGTYEVTLTVTYADGEEASKTIKVNVFANDTTPPTSSHELDPATPNGPNGKYKGVVKVTLSAEDEPGGSGVDRIEYRINGDVWKTYDGPFNVSGNGDYTIEYRAIDLAGNHEEPNSVSFTIDNSAGGGDPCLPLSDEFNGTALDSKWSVLRPASGGPQVSDGELRIPILQGDFIANDPLASNVVLQDAPDGEWTAVTRLNLSEINANGEQAGIVVWKSENPNVFSKIVFIQSNSGNRQFEHIVTQSGSVNPPIAQSITAAPGSLPTQGYVLLRARFTGNQVIGEFSADDGATWTRIGQSGHAAPFTGPFRVGLTAFRGNNGGGTASFDWFRVFARGDAETGIECGGGTCLPEADDFAGNQLDGKWQIFNDNPSTRSVADDHLTLTMAQGDVYQGNFTAQNILLQDAPQAPWTMTARIKHTNISVDGRAAGLVIFGQNNPNYFAKAAIQYKINDPLNGNPINGIWMERTLTTNNAVNGSYGGNWPNSGKLNPPTDYVWVRAVFDGTNVSTYYSLDGVTFTSNAPPFPASALGANGVTKIGLFAKRDGTGSDATVQFDYFHVTGSDDPQQPAECSTGGDNAAPVTTATVDPENPNGDGGWYTSPVEVTLTADDGEGEGVERTEYRIDNGDWTEYDEPFTVGGDGVRTVQYRSIDLAGNEEAPKSLELRIDENAPQTTATLSPGEPDGPNGSYNGPVEITLDADDGSGSGVAETQFRVDGGEWTPYVKEETILGTNASDLDDWLQAGPGGLQYNPNDGGFFRTQGGLGMAWYPKEYKDFRLRLQWRDSSSGSNGNGGVLVRFPDPRIPLDQRPLTGPGDWTGTHCSRTGSAATQPAWVAVFCGHEIQINDHQSDWQKTGSVYNFAPVEAPNAGVQPRGTWVDYEIRVEGQHYTVIRNGQVLNEFDNSIPKNSSRAGDPPTQARQFDRGYIGLQNHGSNDLIDYRNVRVLPLIEGAVEGPIVVEGEGQHKVEFRSVDAAGHTEDLKTVTFRIGDAGEEPGAPALSASVKPAKKTVKAKAKRVNLRFVVTNQGDQVAKNVKLCVKAQKKRLAVKGKQCVTVATIDAGQTVKRKFTLRVQKGARGKASKVKFVARGPGIEKRTVTARVKVKK